MKSKGLAVFVLFGCFALGAFIGITGIHHPKGGPMGVVAGIMFGSIIGMVLMFHLWPNTDRWRKHKRRKLLKRRNSDSLRA